MGVIFLALPFMFLYAFVMAVLRGAGDSKTPLMFMLLSVGPGHRAEPGADLRRRAAAAARASRAPPRRRFFAQSVSLVALIVHLYRKQERAAPAAARAGIAAARLVDRQHADREGRADGTAALRDLVQRHPDDHAGEPVRRAFHRRLRRGLPGLDLHPDAGLRHRHGGLLDGRAERRRAEMGSREPDRGRGLAVQLAGDRRRRAGGRDPRRLPCSGCSCPRTRKRWRSPST